VGAAGVSDKQKTEYTKTPHRPADAGFFIERYGV